MLCTRSRTKDVMKEGLVSSTVLTVILSALVLGGAAVLISAARTTSDIEHEFTIVREDDGSEYFI